MAVRTKTGNHGTVVIRHLVPWEPARHGPAFLAPLVDGVRRRLAAANKRQGAPPDSAG